VPTGQVVAEVRPAVVDAVRPAVVAEVRPAVADAVQPAVAAEVQPEVVAVVQPEVVAEVQPEVVVEVQPEVVVEVQPAVAAVVQPAVVAAPASPGAGLAVAGRETAGQAVRELPASAAQLEDELPGSALAPVRVLPPPGCRVVPPARWAEAVPPAVCGPRQLGARPQP